MRSKLWSPVVWPVMGSIVLAISLSLSAANVPIELGVKGRGNATPTLAADGQFVDAALTTSGPAIYPALAVAGDGVVVAWTNGASAASVIQVARIAGSKAAGTDR